METRPNSTRAQREYFFSSLVWQDLIVEVQSWLADIHVHLETEQNPVEAYRFQGRAEVCRRIFLIPEMLDTLASADMLEEGEEEENGSRPE